MVADPGIACSIMNSLGKIEVEDDNNYSDFTVIVEGIKFPCHRFLLSACSGFFKCLLRSEMKEVSDHSVEVHGMSSSIFTTILRCIYKGENVVTPDNIMDLWHAANQLQIDFIIRECEKFAIEKLIPESINEVYMHAKLLDSIRVVDCVIDHFAKNFDKCVNQSNNIFLYLYPDDIMALLQHKALTVSTEDVVVTTVLQWVSHNDQIGPKGSSVPKKYLHLNDQNKDIISKNIGKPNIDSESKETKADRFDSEADIPIQDFSEKEADVEALKDRQQYLGQLLSCCKLCLVGNNCLEALLNNELALGCREAFSVVRQAIVHQFKPGPWTLMSVHRPTSSLENVILFTENKHLKAFSILSKQTFCLSKIPEETECSNTLTVFNSQVFLRSDQHSSSYYSSCPAVFTLVAPNTWNRLLESFIFRHNFAVYNNFFYFVCESNILKMPVSFMMSSKLISPEAISSETVDCFFKVTKTVVFGKKILFLSSTDHVHAVCLDTQSLKVTKKIVSKSSSHVVSFHDESSVYLLSKDGQLQKLTDSPDGGVNLVFLTKLWGFTWDINGAVVVDRQLYLFGSYNKIIETLGIKNVSGQVLSHDSNDLKIWNAKWPWSSNLPGFFDKINVMFMYGASQVFPFIIPKKWMVN